MLHSIFLLIAFLATWATCVPRFEIREDTIVDSLLGDTEHPKLIPLVPRHVDVGNLNTLAPSSSAQIWYAHELLSEFEDRMHAALDLKWKYPVVVLDHSVLLEASCSQGSLSVKFNSREAYEFALRSWKERSNLIFVTSRASCITELSDGNHAFFVSSGRRFHSASSSVVFGGSFSSIENVASEGKLDWGVLSHSDLRKRDIAQSFSPYEYSTIARRQNTPLVCKPRVAKNVICGQRGILKNAGSNQIPSASSVKTLDACKAACWTDRTCLSISFDSAKSTCKLYKAVPINMKFQAKPTSTVTYFNRKCFSCKRQSTTPTDPTNPPSGGNTTDPTNPTNPPSGGNTTDPTDNGSPSGCSPPSAQISNCPATSYCDADFDDKLDQALGFFDPEDASAVDTFAPGLGVTGNGKLMKRGFFKNLIKKAAAAVVKIAIAPTKAILKVAAKVAVAAVKTVVAVAKAIVTGEFSPSLKVYFPAVFAPPNLDLTPWGYGLKFFQYMPNNPDAKSVKRAKEVKKEKNNLPNNFGDRPGIALYCINCGVKALFTAEGTITFHITKGITKGQLRATGNFYAGLMVGMELMYVKKYKLGSKKLLHKGFPGFEIPGIVVVGPELSIDAEASIEVKAQGQIMGGYNMSMPNAVAVLDLLDSKKSYQQGWTPTYSRALSIGGEVGAALILEMPIGLAFGISLLKGKYKKQVAIVNTPSLEAEAKVSASYTTKEVTLANGTVYTESTPDESVFNDGECPGVQFELSANDRLDADLFGVRGYKLWSTKEVITSACWKLWDKPTATTTSSTTTSAGGGTTPTVGSPSGTPGLPPAPDAPLPTGLNWWHYDYSSDGNNVIDVERFNNNKHWIASGRLTDINSFPMSQWAFDGFYTRVFQGYFSVPSTGSWSINIDRADNEVLVWLGNDAWTNYHAANAKINTWIDAPDNQNIYTNNFENGKKVPITIVWANWGGPGAMNIHLTNPSGDRIDDLSSFFSSDPTAGYNGGLNSLSDIQWTKGTDPLQGVNGQNPTLARGLAYWHFNRVILPSDFRTIGYRTTPWDWAGVTSSSINVFANGNAVYSQVLSRLYQGYIIAPEGSGTYTITSVGSDDIVRMWIGQGAHTTYDATNSDLYTICCEASTVTRSFSFSLTAGMPVRFTMYWANTGGPGHFEVKLKGPSGTEYTGDTSNWLVYDPYAGLNDMGFVPTDNYYRGYDSDPMKQLTYDGFGYRKRDLAPRDDDPAESGDPTSDEPTVDFDDGEVSGPLNDVSIATDDDFDPDSVNSDDKVFDLPDVLADPYFGTVTNQPIDTTDGGNPDDGTDGMTYANIPDITGAVQLHLGDDNNFYLTDVDASDGAGQFAGVGNVFSGTLSGNILVYYADELAAYGVSRFRGVPETAIPLTARLIALAPLPETDGSTNYIYVAANPAGDTWLWPVMCNFNGTDSQSKVFLVEDPDVGVATLARPELAWTVTGGDVTSCGPLAFRAPGPPVVEA